MLPFSLFFFFFKTYCSDAKTVGDRGDNKELELEKHNFKVMFLFNAMPYQYIDPLFILMHRKF
jgi:hypothetical protein